MQIVYSPLQFLRIKICILFHFTYDVSMCNIIEPRFNKWNPMTYSEDIYHAIILIEDFAIIKFCILIYCNLNNCIYTQQRVNSDILGYVIIEHLFQLCLPLLFLFPHLVTRRLKKCSNSISSSSGLCNESVQK